MEQKGHQESTSQKAAETTGFLCILCERTYVCVSYDTEGWREREANEIMEVLVNKELQKKGTMIITLVC